MKEVFEDLDHTKTGMLTHADLKLAFCDLPVEDINTMISNIDSSGNGKINYTEFLIATFEFKPYLLNQEYMQALFKYFDAD